MDSPIQLAQDEHYNIGGKPNVVFYAYINHHAGGYTKIQEKTHDELGLYSQLCDIRFEIGFKYYWCIGVKCSIN